MNLNQLRYFQTICIYNNITKAAEKMNISQPSVSNSLKALEEEFGVNLFERVNNKLYITPEGELFLLRANKILKDIDDLSSTMQNIGKKQSSVIRLGVSPLVGGVLFSQIFTDYKAIYPNSEFELYEEYHLTLRKMVEDNEIDFSFTIIDDNYEDNYRDNLEINFIKELELCFCVNKNNPLANKKKLNINLIKKEPIVFYKKNSYHYMILMKLYEKYNFSPNVIFSTNRPQMIKDYVMNHNVSAFLLKSLINKNDNIIPISLEEPIMIKTGLVWKKNKTLLNTHKIFRNFVLNHFKQ
jgi:DNA-binding transcriptional LysR family regulator